MPNFTDHYRITIIICEMEHKAIILVIVLICCGVASAYQHSNEDGRNVARTIANEDVNTLANAFSVFIIGRIESMQPKRLVLNSNKPYNPHDSRAIITEAGEGGNTETFKYFNKSYKNSGEISLTGVLATYNLQYVLKVGPANASVSWREIHYVIPPSPLDVETLPSWATPDSGMLFDLVIVDYKLGGPYKIRSHAADGLLFMDAKDEAGTFVNMVPADDVVKYSQLFKLEQDNN